MRHARAASHLAELGTASLDPTVERAVIAHAEGCSACREWLETRDWLAGALSKRSRAEGMHLDSNLLALCAIRPEEIDEPDRDEVRLHLRHCVTCHAELTQVRAAIREARPRAKASTSPTPLPLSWSGPRPAQALAAALAVLLLGAGLVVVGFVFGSSDSGAGASPPVAAGSRPADMLHEKVEQLSGQSLEGTHFIGSERDLMVSQLTIRSGADVQFRATDVVAFGDGFRVESGARIAVASERGNGATAARE